MLVQQERTRPRQYTASADDDRIPNGNGNHADETSTRTLQIDFRSGYYRSQLLRKDPVKFSRRHTLYEYLSENLYKVVILGLVFISILLLIWVKNKGESSALLCVEPNAKVSQVYDHYPDVNFEKVQRVKDKGKFRVFKAPKWIVVAVSSSPPTDKILSMVKMQGWQVLIMGDSETPPNWDVRGAIYLSVEQQAALGYRILAHMPYNSYVRKSVGYLFAIQHGAKVIYDADENASIIGGDLSTVFDLELSGPKMKSSSLLQYTAMQNRSIVNPYIHFGQRSVWPRGFPIELVSNINPEVYYGNISSGNQFIQQGLTNGYPDVDSIFYHTRKAEVQSFDIKFDPHALPVALPKGTMAPVNNLNTVFHPAAFWALMLPVSVTPQVSDLLRGYFAQRLLWEIGGHIAFYPPSVYRKDMMKAHVFEDEKHLHDNIDRLIKFLLGWSSNKETFFDRVLDLSYEMGKKGFWTMQDVAFTADWLQDLLSFGYSQPKLSPLVDVQTGKENNVEFLPLALPSIHLGVDDVSTVGFEVGNLLRWKKFFGNTVLIMECSWPVNQTALAWRMLYGRFFRNVILISSNSDKKYGVLANENWQTYKLLSDIFQQYDRADGFLFIKDYVILNYWNLLQADKNKLWNLHTVSDAWELISHEQNGTEWYFKSSIKRTVKKMVKSLPVHFRIKYRENIDDKHFVRSKSEAFYIPKRFKADFIDLTSIALQAKIHNELAIPLFFMAMDNHNSFDPEAFSNVVYETNKTSAAYSAEAHIVRPITATNERQLLKIMKLMAAGDPLLLEVL